MKSPHILLHGVGGVYNFGCEAILRGTEIVLHEVWPDAVIRYASVCPQDDTMQLVDVPIEIVARMRYPKYSMRNIVRRLAIDMNISWNPLAEWTDYIDDVDVVLSIGGDRYNLWPSGKFNRELIPFGETVLKKGKKLVLWGASVGPFEEKPRIKKLFKKHLHRMHLITAREPNTVEYLKKLGISDTVIFCADPAFAVVGHQKTRTDVPQSLRIGINFSPLSLLFQEKPKDRERIQLSHAHMVERLVREIGAEIILLPHVIKPSQPNDDDLGYLRIIKSMVNENIHDSIQILENAGGFLAVKEEIVKCNVVIAARMHCAINSIAACVPTLLISYSTKSIGMAKYVYGDEDNVVPVAQSGSDDMIVKLKNILKREHEIRKLLQHRIEDIQQDVRLGARALEALLT